MPTDLALRNLKARATLYKVADRDGMYAVVSPKGTITFRYDYRVNGRRQTLTISRYGFGGISLAEAPEKLRHAGWLLGDPAVHGGRRVVFLASDDDSAAAEIAEGLHFARAAERLHIEQSPLKTLASNSFCVPRAALA